VRKKNEGLVLAAAAAGVASGRRGCRRGAADVGCAEEALDGLACFRVLGEWLFFHALEEFEGLTE